MDLSISIVSWNTCDIMDQCLQSIHDTTSGIEFEVVVVDNASTDGSSSMVREKYPSVVLIANDGNVGFAAGNNQAYRSSTGRHFLLLNPDTICREGALEGLVRFLDERPAVGAVGPTVLNDDGTLQYSWAMFPTVWSEARGFLDRRIRDRKTPHILDEPRNVAPFEADWIGGCCLMIRRDAVEQIGLMDESLFMYSEEMDWCKRLAIAGWEVWVEPGCEIVHLGGRSSVQAKAEAAGYLRASKRRYFQKHHGVLSGVVVGGALAARAALKAVLRTGRTR